MNSGSKKIFRAKAPDKGSFPLDHDGECKDFMKKYMKCLKENSNENYKCRVESKEYLQCRMDKQLMTKEDFGKLGYHDESATMNSKSDLGSVG